MGWRSCGEKNLAETLYGGMGVLETRKQIQLWGLPVGLSFLELSASGKPIYLGRKTVAANCPCWAEQGQLPSHRGPGLTRQPVTFSHAKHRSTLLIFKLKLLVGVRSVCRPVFTCSHL